MESMNFLWGPMLIIAICYVCWLGFSDQTNLSVTEDHAVVGAPATKAASEDGKESVSPTRESLQVVAESGSQRSSRSMHTYIFVDPETGVHYLVVEDGYGGGIGGDYTVTVTPMYNADGTLLIQDPQGEGAAQGEQNKNVVQNQQGESVVQDQSSKGVGTESDR